VQNSVKTGGTAAVLNRRRQITDAERAAVLRGSRFRSVQAVGAGGQRTRKTVAVFRKYFYARDFLPVPGGARTLAKGNAQMKKSLTLRDCWS